MNYNSALIKQMHMVKLKDFLEACIIDTFGRMNDKWEFERRIAKLIVNIRLEIE